MKAHLYLQAPKSSAQYYIVDWRPNVELQTVELQVKEGTSQKVWELLLGGKKHITLKSEPNHMQITFNPGLTWMLGGMPEPLLPFDAQVLNSFDWFINYSAS